MRYSFYILACLFLFNQAVAQDKKSKKDTVAKTVYSEIVKVDSSNRYELFKKASKWVESQGFKIEEEDPYGGKIVAKNKFEVYTDKGVLAKPNGSFTHDVIIDIKEGKYRYTFSNFMYSYIKQDRTYKYVTVKGQKPMEENNAPGWKKQWGKNKMQVSNKINAYIVSLRETMKYVAPKPVAPPKPKEEW